MALPLALTALRVLLAPVVILLALGHPSRTALAACMIAAFLSDVFDGIIARRLGVATPALRRLDSVVDSIFYLAVLFAAWHLHPEAITGHAAPLIALVALEIARYLFDYLKFSREASYHMWSSKLWGIALFLCFLLLLGFGVSGIMVPIAIWLGIVADLEGLAISLALDAPRTDVPTIVHALRIRHADARGAVDG